MFGNRKLDAPEIRAVLEANRAKLSLMQQQKEASAAGASTKTGSAAPAGGSAAPPTAAPPKQHHLGEQLRSNPVFTAEASAAPASTSSSGDYAPKYAGAMRLPSAASGASAATGLPPVGDLFAPQPQLPLGVRLAAATPPVPGSGSTSTAAPTPHFAGWDATRAFLTGRFLFDAAADRASGAAPAAPSIPLESYPPAVQETLLVEDLLHAFSGLDGTWVRACVTDGRSGPQLQFRIAARGQLEPALLEMAGRMLPLCEYVAVVQRYTETRRQYEWGLVCQAFAGAARQVLADWGLMLAQLEHQLRKGKLTLQALWYYVQPPMAALRLLATLAAEASAKRLRGAGLLDLLHAKAAAVAGDAAAHRLALRLLRAAAEPYFAMLERWLCEGAVDDPYSEFLVQEDAAITKEALSADGGSAFWADRFTLRLATDPITGAPPPPPADAPDPGAAVYDVPSFLCQAQRAILDTGKNLNLVRSCGRQPERPLPPGCRLEFDEGGRFLLRVEEAHRAAATAAMALLHDHVGLSHGMASLKRYFLVAQGDLFLAFMDFGDAELTRQAGQASLAQLQSLLELSVRSSSAEGDPAAARLQAAYDHRSVLNMLITITSAMPAGAGGNSPRKRPRLKPVSPAPMTAAERSTVGRQKLARESFMLSCRLPWPLSVVAPDSAVAQYQMIFRHLFELKWVDRELSRVAALYQATTPLANLQRRAARRDSLAPSAGAAAAQAGAGAASASWAALSSAYRTCQLMTHFFRQYLLYVTFEVLEPLWAALMARIDAAHSLDEIIEHHQIFLRKVMKGLLLSRKVVVLRALLGLKDVALAFVGLSSAHVTLDHAAIAADVDAGMAGRKGLGSHRERHEARQVRGRAALSQVLANPEFSVPVSDLRRKFESKCGEFMSALGEAHRQASSERSDTREELEGLLNLMARLDFNGYFSAGGADSLR